MVNVNIYKTVNIFKEGLSYFYAQGYQGKIFWVTILGLLPKNIRLDCLYRIGILETFLQEIGTSLK